MVRLSGEEVYPNNGGSPQSRSFPACFRIHRNILLEKCRNPDLKALLVDKSVSACMHVLPQLTELLHMVAGGKFDVCQRKDGFDVSVVHMFLHFLYR
jgi:hypothetical protein